MIFRWEADPPSDLYRQSSFRIDFPEPLDLSRVPERAWWTIALACLHPHWVFLKPCEVRLPVRLGPGEAETWLRLMDAQAATLEAYRRARPCGEGPGTAETSSSFRGGSDTERTVGILEGSASPAPWSPVPDSGRCAAAFSGGKDSLLQAALLSELTERPVLVCTTSPMPPLGDHSTARRRRVLSEISTRRDVELVEVRSDFRGCWDNGFSQRLGYTSSVNELTDTFLYFGSLLATGLALGASRLFLASEAEVQQNAEHDGWVIQHPHCMYSGVTQRALQALLAPAGVHYGSLTLPLWSAQVQGLLWKRYPDICDLQYSCWRVQDGESACGRCSQCLRISLCALAAGEDPGRMGMDLARVLWSMRHWTPTPLSEGGRQGLRAKVVGRSLQLQVVRHIQATPLGRVFNTLRKRPRWFLDPKVPAALCGYSFLRRRHRAFSAGEEPGYRAGFLRLIDPLLRERVAAVYAAHLKAEDDASHAAVLSRADSLARWIAEPIGGLG